MVALADQSTRLVPDDDAGDCQAAARYRPLLAIFAAVALGVMLDRFLRPSWAEWIATWAVGLVVWWSMRYGPWFGLRRLLPARLLPARLVPVLLGFRPASGVRRWSACGIFVASVAAGGAWHHAQWRLFADDDLGLFAGRESKPICAELVALSRPRLLPAPRPDPMRVFPVSESSRLVARAVRIRSGDGWRPVSGRVLLTCRGRLPAIRAGDRLRVFGMLDGLASPANPGQRDRSAYARADRRLCRLRATFPAAVRVVRPGSGWSLTEFLQSVRSGGRNVLYRYIHPHRAPLAAAILLGFREELGAERNECFLVTGTMHLLAISGLHVGVLAGGVWWFGRIVHLPRRTALVSVAGFVVAYALLTELRPSVVRATLLIVAWSAGRLLERRAEPLNALAAAALLIIALQPSALFQTGAQLSFLAVATLTCLPPQFFGGASTDPLRRLIQQSRPRLWRWTHGVAVGLKQIWLTGAVVWLVTLPLALDRFHVAAFVALGLNVLVALPLAVSLFTGLLTLLLGPLVPLLAGLTGAVCDASLASMEACIAAARHLPFGHAWLPQPPAWYLAIYYLTWSLYVVLPRWRPRHRLAFWSLVLASLLAVGLTPALRKLKYAVIRQPMTMTVVSVGHGTSVLCEFTGGETLLYDAGSLAAPASSVDAISACLWERGITGLDRVVLSHADADHYNALPGLLKRFRVNSVEVPPQMFAQPPPAVSALQDALRKAGVPVRCRVAGESWRVGDSTRIRVLHPPPGGVPGNDNANSLVLRISYSGWHVLLPGDLENAGLDRLLAEPPEKCQVVLAPHHGSALSRPLEVVRWARPRWMIESGGQAGANIAKQPLDQAGVRVLRTARTGAVRVELDSSGIRVRCWRHSNGSTRWIHGVFWAVKSSASARGPPRHS